MGEREFLLSAWVKKFKWNLLPCDEMAVFALEFEAGLGSQVIRGIPGGLRQLGRRGFLDKFPYLTLTHCAWSKRILEVKSSVL
jgi:hypothetical protein